MSAATAGVAPVARLSAREVAQIMGSPPPTAEQEAVIEAGLGPTVVIAGAGSGKTTVLAQRIVYLVANGLIEPSAILGLTFTRKAVGELGHRIRRGLAALRHWQRQSGTAGAPGRAPAPPRPLDGLDVPSVQTYNAYAAGLVRDYGMAIGVEPDTVLLDDASATLLAGRIVDAAGPAEVPAGRARSTIVTAVLELAGQIDEHLSTPARVVEHIDASLAALLNPDYLAALDATIGRKKMPTEDKAELRARLAGIIGATGGAPPKLWSAATRAELVDFICANDLSSDVAALEAKRRLAGLVERFRSLKRARHAMQFSDQVAFAHRIMAEDAQALEIERSRWQLILLDEYQDTSDSQAKLLQLMFAGLPVMAVGDPRQSIYAWRGASAGNIGQFPLDFPGPDGGPGRTLGLTTSWRNSRRVLAVANRIAAQLPDIDPAAQLTAAPTAQAGDVALAVTVGHADADYGTDQLASLATWMAGTHGTRAVLCRKRADFASVAAALEQAGLEVIMAGSAGGLDDPYVADVFAALNVVVDPGAGEHLMRLLTGASCALGAADVAALGRLRRLRQRRLEVALGASADDVEPIGLAECLDDLAAQQPGPQLSDDIAAAGLSGDARERAGRLARSLRRLRAAQTTVTGLVREAVRELRIDAEIEALAPARAAEHRAAIDALLSTVAGYVATDPAVRAEDLLAWLALAEESAALAVAEAALPDGSDPADRSVVVMTVHASKGLEFDAVAIPNLVVGDLPSTPRDGRGWLSLGRLPYPLRGDRDKLPRFDLTATSFASQKELADWLKGTLGPALSEQSLAEERRLAYVAITRARTKLWLGAAAHSPRRTRRSEFSPFLLEAIEALGAEVELPAEDAEVEAGDAPPVPWPVEPPAAELALRTAVLRQLAATPAVALDALADGPAAPYARRALDLLADRAPREFRGALPERLSTTSIVALRADRSAFLTDLARPMPQGPAPAAALGTAFHAWVEQRYGQAALEGLADEAERRRLPAELEDRFDRLCRTFEASEFAQREPLAIELPFELDLGGVHIPGKIDAVFDRGEGIEVIDWKTGGVPDDERLAAMTVQLSVYALAVEKMDRFSGREVGGAFYFVADDRLVRPERLLGPTELAELLRGSGP
ncbi:ATP-dependent DNA helicase [Brevibacterium sp. BRM-1]|uniref:ATP-dependent helicase n=1 Tax=Brevibacterium sp. BRM-1 TaxID=2999062 RepID=UPI0022819388|nr:ATP-dependent DNA helicase [Brevibacterium sp. BRM-1]WAL40496.1 ATP-dependent DNA helicase [Brevibacterium sp. BRM-1]